MSFRLDRRTVLRGLLGSTVVSIALPPLDIFFNSHGTAYAGGLPFPTRFGIYFWGNGVRPDRWVPTRAGSGDQWQLSEELAPLAPHKDKITVISGLQVKIPNRIPHWSGAAGILSATSGRGRDNSYTMAAQTIDQVVADGIEAQGGVTRFRSIEYGAFAEGGLSYNGPNSLNPAETSPRSLFERVFTDGFRLPGDDPDPRMSLRRSVLDAVYDQGKQLASRLGTTDRQRLEQHFESIRALERRIEFIENNPVDLAACTVPEEPTLEANPMEGGHPQISAANQALTDVMALALACDQTRVFSNWITRPVNNLLFEGTEAGHHQLTHDEPGDQPQVHAIVLQLIEEYNRMLGVLDSIPEGDGTLLDHCLIFGTTDVSEGRIHSLDEFPVVLAGSAGGRIRTGMHLRANPGENATRLLIALQQALDIPVETFGEEEALASGALPGLLTA